MLNESGLENFDEQIINILVNSDAETTKKNVEAFTNLVNQMLKSNKARTTSEYSIK